MIPSLHIVGSKTLGGAERFFLRLTEALDERGHPITLALRAGSEVVAAVREGLPVRESPLRTVWDPISRRDISRLIKEIRPDIVQTYMGRATRQTHLPRGRRPVHIARIGGYYKLNGYTHAHAWVGNTRGVCDYMVREGLPADRVFHISNFIDAPRPVAESERVDLRAELGIPEDALALVTAGRLIEVKGHAYLLEAFSRLPRTVDDRPLWLVMVGDGPLREGLQDQARQLGIADRVAWAGWRTDPAPFFALADLVVFPSLDAETLGNVILEAWAFRKPLVTAQFRGAREITCHGEDAWQVPCGDSKALAAGIETVLGDEPLAAALAETGHARVNSEFSRDAIVDQYLDLYETLLQGL